MPSKLCGNASYLVPLLGESFDLVWGPCQVRPTYISITNPGISPLKSATVQTPSEICGNIFGKQLYLCLFMDLICGNASYLVLLLGESFDLIWGPCQVRLSNMFPV
jgi:hypothetical protein